MISSDAFALLGGAGAGFLGALVGIGGGVFLVPLLDGLLGLSFSEARGVSLIGVLGTSSSAAMAPTGRRLVNPRLAIVLLLFSVTGATLGARLLWLFSDRTYEVMFGVTTAVVAALMLSRRNIRNVLPAETTDLGMFGGRIHDDDQACEVTYRLKRLPVAAGISSAPNSCTHGSCTNPPKTRAESNVPAPPRRAARQRRLCLIEA